ncbi:kielin/chordin-like protein [Diaphorina citri]|uniref:Kielin/chordin-like protein n=1 Tax=Diaphorina citri TaxID=121845 RepID=A0A3Q0IZP2_DIACI|nr:kielin/chordin-like protein [Diaphorina citri]
MQCYAPCKHPTPPGPGQCCPTCPGCRFVSGRNATLVEDSCLKCQCARGHLTCVKRACPVLACPTTFMEWRPGQCCPQCTGHRNIMENADNSLLSTSCTLGQEFHVSGQKFQLDRCTKCSCHNATSVCSRETCPVLDCPPDQIIPGGPKKCCSTCPTDVELPKYCTYNGKIYQIILIQRCRFVSGRNATLVEDSCLKCQCARGHLTCVKRACPVLACPTTFMEWRPGQCCPQCTGHRNIMENADNSLLSTSCTLGQEFHVSGQKFQLDRCTKCSCHNATSVCSRETCPVLDCPPDQIIPGGPKKCCSTCPTDVELPKYCTYNGKIYQDGSAPMA